MPTRSVTITIDAKLAEAYNSAPKTRQKKALSAMRRMLSKATNARSLAPSVLKKEAELFLRITRNLSPPKRRRFEELRMRREDEKLTKKEHAEMLTLIEEMERIWVDRLRAIVDLAKLRRVSPQKLFKRLENDLPEQSLRREY
jgi:hypothetical protein